jgi:hypothetical protein
MERQTHHSFNESQLLMRLLSTRLPPHCQADPIQPTMTAGFNHRHSFGIWDNGTVTVFDRNRHRKEGAFYHFSRYKNKARFTIDPQTVEHNKWGIGKYGVRTVDSFWSYSKLQLALFI